MKKGSHHSEKTKKLISEAKIGKDNGCTGYKHTEEKRDEGEINGQV